ncbi:hypothetical protein CEE37_10470 [candidate division LCP-89 bacterium B3_LCP]|uniref:Secretion system C-terminal sorting domain-containing protein n=1 Tax=candidate division LCP-89 bacterium B3_LCP TaxID=2012998 RepID=A0A532UXN5_UNCL8|nr:MAG: hypothetical protein CEE37_10470 [candidate division LCP-89 bacterium B3_LCP]
MVRNKIGGMKMKKFVVILCTLIFLTSCALAQNLSVPPAGQYFAVEERVVQPSNPQPCDWPWVGFCPLLIANPTGLAFDGQYFWIPRWSAGVGDPYIYKVDMTGNIVGHINSPALWPGGITWDGSHLWVTDYVGGPVICKVDPMTGAVVTSFPIVYSSYWAGVAWDGQYLYYGTNTGSPGSHTIYKIDPNTGAQVGTISVPSQDISGLTYYDGHLYYSDSQTFTLYQITMTGTIVDSSPTYVPAWLAGVTVEGGYLWNVDYDNENLNYYDLGAPTPVELTAFNANVAESGVLLTWNTASENECYSWTILRNNIEIATLPGAGTTEEPQSYSYLDEVGNGTYTYKLMQTDISGATSYSDEVTVTIGIANKFQLMQNYPNPFNPQTSLSFSLPDEGYVTLIIYDTQGCEVARLADGYKVAGTYDATFDAHNLPSGIYFANLNSTHGSLTQKLLLVK